MGMTIAARAAKERLKENFILWDFSIVSYLSKRFDMQFEIVRWMKAETKAEIQLLRDKRINLLVLLSLYRKTRNCRRWLRFLLFFKKMLRNHELTIDGTFLALPLCKRYVQSRRTISSWFNNVYIREMIKNCYPTKSKFILDKYKSTIQLQ
jgi:hypothetical protein